jgi:hypothetical protein
MALGHVLKPRDRTTREVRLMRHSKNTSWNKAPKPAPSAKLLFLEMVAVTR